MKLQESPVFQEMKAAGKHAQMPLKESFIRWRNFRMVLLVLFGIVAGQAVVGYASGFYVYYFLTQTLKVYIALQA
jgi:nitrate reductase NapE component